MTLGRVRLQEYVRKVRIKKIMQSDVAKSIGCSRSYLSELLNGVKMAPSIELAGRIEKITKVKIGDWNKPEIKHE